MIPRLPFVAAILFALAGCASVVPGSDFPRTASAALSTPESTRLGRQFDEAARRHDGASGFRLLSAGVDGFLVRAELANTAERTLDLQYFILRADETGRLLADALLRAADRGVRVRVLIDDAEIVEGDDPLAALDSHPNIEIRVFNPFRYRGRAPLFRALEFMLDSSRLDYRMHNKLFVADNAIALVGGRNIGNAYFQIDPDSQFADDDVLAAGPVVRELSATFDDYWNSTNSIPIAALAVGARAGASLADYRKALAEHRERIEADGIDYAGRIAIGAPLAGMLSGELPLVWARARVVVDSPRKKEVLTGDSIGDLILPAVAGAIADVKSELMMVTPYLIPGKEGMRLLEELRRRNVRVRILTNSLESSNVLPAQAAYMRYRLPMLREGIEIHEIRSRPGTARGSGETAAMTRYGNYSLHGKMYVFDRSRLYVGSMNFDQRSMYLNTEVGLIIDSPALALQVASRFEAMEQPANSYTLALVPGAEGGPPRIVWITREGSALVEHESEPARSTWQRLEAEGLSALPIDSEM